MSAVLLLSTGRFGTGPTVALCFDGPRADDNETLKALLIKVWPAHVAHLDQCKSSQSSTGKRSVIVRISIFTASLGLIMCTMSLAAGAPARPQTHTVTIEGMQFVPEVLTVAPGDTVVWVNRDLVPHTATSKTGNFDSKDIQVDKSWKYTIRKTGDFAYTCTFHPTMKAMLRVKP